MHAKELTLLSIMTTLVGEFGRIKLERVVGAIMELSEQDSTVDCTIITNPLQEIEQVDNSAKKP